MPATLKAETFHNHTALDDSNKPPPNPMHAWMRVIMWLLPTGFAWGSGVGLNWLISLSRLPSELGMCFWVMLNVAFLVGAGWYRGALLDQEGYVDWRFVRIAAFFGLQLLLIPLLSVVILFAICVANPIKI